MSVCGVNCLFGLLKEELIAILRGNQSGILPRTGPKLQKVCEKLIKPLCRLPLNSTHVFTGTSLDSKALSSFVISFMAA